MNPIFELWRGGRHGVCNVCRRSTTYFGRLHVAVEQEVQMLGCTYPANRSASYLSIAATVLVLVCSSTPNAAAGPITFDASTSPVSGIIGQSKPLKVLYDNAGEAITARIALLAGDPLEQLNRLATVRLL